MCHTRYHRPRKVVRHISLDPARRKSRDKYDAIVDRLGAMADQEDRKEGGMPNLEQFTVCALLGFGCREIDLRTGAYGRELGSSLRRQARTERDHRWHRKLKIPITNRISKAASAGRFGNVSGDGSDDLTVTLADSNAIDTQKYKSPKWGGEKLETPNKGPRTLACFKSSSNQQMKLYFMLYGWEHEDERKAALKQLLPFHERKPELFTVSFLATC